MCFVNLILCNSYVQIGYVIWMSTVCMWAPELFSGYNLQPNSNAVSQLFELKICQPF